MTGKKLPEMNSIQPFASGLCSRHPDKDIEFKGSIK